MIDSIDVNESGTIKEGKEFNNYLKLNLEFSCDDYDLFKELLNLSCGLGLLCPPHYLRRN